MSFRKALLNLVALGNNKVAMRFFFNVLQSNLLLSNILVTFLIKSHLE